jgi:hypothetical protein
MLPGHPPVSENSLEGSWTWWHVWEFALYSPILHIELRLT